MIKVVLIEATDASGRVGPSKLLRSPCQISWSCFRSSTSTWYFTPSPVSVTTSPSVAPPHLLSTLGSPLSSARTTQFFLHQHGYADRAVDALTKKAGMIMSTNTVVCHAYIQHKPQPCSNTSSPLPPCAPFLALPNIYPPTLWRSRRALTVIWEDMQAFGEVSTMNLGVWVLVVYSKRASHACKSDEA